MNSDMQTTSINGSRVLIVDDTLANIGVLLRMLGSAHKQSHDELLRIASTDPLTNHANRRQLDSVLELEWNRAQRTQGVISLAIMDVDFFKTYNDTLGHQAGDRYLQQVAQAIKSVANRPTDLAARFGAKNLYCCLPPPRSTTRICWPKRRA